MHEQSVIDWANFKDEDSVRQALEQHVPPSAPKGEVKSFAAAQGLECSDFVGGVIYCSAPATTDLPFTRARWLIKFYFQGDKLQSTSVTLGLTGP
jgi:hypothetical protein